MIISNAEEPWR